MRMTVFFVEPPPPEAEGGIDLAMTTLENYLRSDEVEVVRNAQKRDLPKRETAETVVHFHGLWQPRHSWVSYHCRRRGIPYVVSPHGMLEPWAWGHKTWKKRPYWHLVERFHLQRADRVLATSQLEAENLAAFVGSKHIETIPLALTEDVKPDYEHARQSIGWSPDEIVLLYLSRIHPKKGLHLLLEALMWCSETAREQVRVVVVGNGPDEYVERLHDIAHDNRHQLPPIDWEGGVWGDRKWTYMQGADLFCLPTHSENFGLVVLEACQVGTPVLTTTGTPWGLLEDWDSGLVVEPDASALQSAIQEYLMHWTWTGDDRRRLARRTRERFDMSVVGPQYERIYDHMLEDKRAYS